MPRKAKSHIAMCHHCSGSGWLDTLKDVGKAALGTVARTAANSLGGPVAGTVVDMGLKHFGMGRAERPKIKRVAPAWLKERNALVKEVAQTHSLSIPEASRYVKTHDLWHRS
jgi:hypothetical protein